MFKNQKCNLNKKLGISKYREILLILLFLSIGCVSASADTASGDSSWWDSNRSDSMVWNSRIPITLTEHFGISQKNEPVTIRMNDLFGYDYDFSKINTNSIRIVDPSASPDENGEINGNDVPSQIEHTGGSSDLSSNDILVFVSNVTANSQKTYYIYYSRDLSVTHKSYSPISWNLVKNPGFESGNSSIADNWQSQDRGYSRISGIAHTGTYSIRMASMDSQQLFGLRQIIPVSPTKKLDSITIGGWMKADNVNGIRDQGNSILTNTYYDPSGALYAQTVYFDIGSHDWQLYEIIIHPTSAVKEIVPYIYFKNHSGTVLWDDITAYSCVYLVTLGAKEDRGIVNPDPPKSAIHPRLYFSAADLPLLKAKMQKPPTTTTWDEIERNTLRITSFPTGINDDNVQWDVWNALHYTSFYYALTGNTTIGNKGKTWLLQICSWPSWTPLTTESHNRVNFHTGKIAIAVGEAYDMLYPLLTEEERATVRLAILEKAVKPAYLDYVDGSYFADARTNRAAQIYGGIGVSALAIMGDDTNEGDLIHYFNASDTVMKEYLNAYDPDGAWSEGVGYTSYGLCDASGALFYLEAVKRVKGQNLYSYQNFAHVMDYLLFMLPPDKKSATDSFGDTGFNEGFSSGAIEILSNAYNDGRGKWYLSNSPLIDHDKVSKFIWYNATIPESSPSPLPTLKIFRGVGVVVMRTGWGLTDLMLNFKSGPVFPGHNRPEQNSFTLDALGERLIVEPGMPALGYTDPNYLSYYAATISQNTILINRDPHSQSEQNINGDVISKKAGTITESFGENFYYEVIGDAKDAYNGKLSKFNRHIVFIKPDYIIILDDLESANGPVEFDSLLHSIGTNNIAVNGNNITITRNNVKLYIRAFIPGFTYSTAAGQPYITNDGALPTSYIKMYSSSPSLSASYLYVLTPKKGDGIAPQITKLQNGSVTGVRIQQNTTIDIVLFNPSGAGITLAGVATDGNKAYVRLENGIVTRYAMQNGKILSYNGTLLFSESKTTSIAQYGNINSRISSYIGIYQNGVWYLDMDGSGTWNAGTDAVYNFGAPGWTPLAGDWNGDGKTEIGIYKDGVWYLDRNGNGAWDAGTDNASTFGTIGWTSVVGDWNGDGKTEIGVYKDGVWYLDWNGNGAWDAGTDKVYNFGTIGWTSVVGDWNGDGKTEIGIYKDGVWYLDWNRNGAWDAGTDKVYNFGTIGWTSVVGKWN